MEFIGLDYHKQYTVATRIRPDGRKDSRVFIPGKSEQISRSLYRNERVALAESSWDYVLHNPHSKLGQGTPDPIGIMCTMWHR